MIRFGFTLIELVFAIVIMGIAILAIPTMTQVNDRGVTNNLKQEAIFAGVAKMMQVLSYPWDENSINLDNNSSLDLERPVDIVGDTTNYARRDINGTVNLTSEYRVGQIRGVDFHRKLMVYDNNITDDNRTSIITALGNNNPNVVALDELAGSYSLVNAGASAVGYKDSYTNVVNVGYVPDGGSSPTPYNFSNTLGTTPTHMKIVSVQVSDGNGIVTTLYAYSANIGQADFYSRRY